MGLNNDMLGDIGPLVLDIETTAHPDAEKYLEPLKADGRLTDPVKIAQDIKAKENARLEKLAVDWNVGRVAAIGYWTEKTGVVAIACPTEREEATLIAELWRAVRGRTIVVFNGKSFDLPYLIQRSRLLGIHHPDLELGKYTKRGIVDLFSELTFNNGTYDQGAMRRTLHAFCRRFGLMVEDTTTGADNPRLIAAGQWASVLRHVESDVALTVELARKLGYVPKLAPEMVL